MRYLNDMEMVNWPFSKAEEHMHTSWMSANEIWRTEIRAYQYQVYPAVRYQNKGLKDNLLFLSGKPIKM